MMMRGESKRRSVIADLPRGVGTDDDEGGV